MALRGKLHADEHIISSQYFHRGAKNAEGRISGHPTPIPCHNIDTNENISNLTKFYNPKQLPSSNDNIYEIYNGIPDLKKAITSGSIQEGQFILQVKSLGHTEYNEQYCNWIRDILHPPREASYVSKEEIIFPNCVATVYAGQCAGHCNVVGIGDFDEGRGYGTVNVQSFEEALVWLNSFPPYMWF